jgi:hypothetical protein
MNTIAWNYESATYLKFNYEARHLQADFALLTSFRRNALSFPLTYLLTKDDRWPMLRVCEKLQQSSEFRKSQECYVMPSDIKYSLLYIFFFLLLYSPIVGLGRLHETFRFISVTRSRTVDWTPWTRDQLVARPLPTAPDDCDDGEVGGMNGCGRGNQSTRRKPAPTQFCPPQIPLARLVREPGPPRWEASDIYKTTNIYIKWLGCSNTDLL